MLFGFNNNAPILLKILGFTTNDIPRFRDCFLKDNSIVIHTRTGGGNREYYENAETHKQNFYGDIADWEEYSVYNDDLRKHPNFVTDVDDDFDCTYANFFYSFPDEFKDDLIALAAKDEAHMPSDRWKALFKAMDESKSDE